jgi:hypothetical protein
LQSLSRQYPQEAWALLLTVAMVSRREGGSGPRRSFRGGRRWASGLVWVTRWRRVLAELAPTFATGLHIKHTGFQMLAQAYWLAGTGSKVNGPKWDVLGHTLIGMTTSHTSSQSPGSQVKPVPVQVGIPPSDAGLNGP